MYIIFQTVINLQIDDYMISGHLGQNHLETNFVEINFPNAKTLIWAFWLAQISVFVFGKLVYAKTLIWALWLAQISVFAFGKLVSAKLVSRWFYPKYLI